MAIRLQVHLTPIPWQCSCTCSFIVRYGSTTRF